MTVFLKLGGSLITDKHTPQAARAGVLARLMREIAEARAAQPQLRLLLGHGSGSFGHMEAREHGTRQGVRTPAEWRGFADVQAAAARLNRLVVDAARAAGLPVVNLPPSASAVCRAGAIENLAAALMEAALAHGLVPMVFGDVAFDLAQGGTIVSTEDVFAYLARLLRPERILLAGIEPGVLSRWPDGQVVSDIAPDAALDALGGSHAADVTGGMASKVREMQRLAQAVPGLSIHIFTGAEPGLLRDTLLGRAAPGTRIGAP
ncbi:MAG: isopentenyl phosphate kinase family protein [Anaerolineales bacterium]|nr:isopentenyl phosphate kinase family protein [Anaerolineales bacterium]